MTFVAGCLHGAGGGDAGGDGGADLARGGGGQIARADRRNLDVQVDPVEQRTGDARLVFACAFRGAGAGALGIAEISAPAFERCLPPTLYKSKT
jgi:hypothetical protein